MTITQRCIHIQLGSLQTANQTITPKVREDMELDEETEDEDVINPLVHFDAICVV